MVGISIKGSGENEMKNIKWMTIKIIFVFLVFNLIVNSFATSETQPHGEQRDLSAQNDTIPLKQSIAQEVLTALDRALTDATKTIERTLIFTILEEDDSIIVEDTQTFARNVPPAQKNKVKIRNMNSVLDNFYSKQQYDTIVLNVSDNVEYGYLYRIIDRFEKYVEDLYKTRAMDIKIRYIFTKPTE